MGRRAGAHQRERQVIVTDVAGLVLDFGEILADPGSHRLKIPVVCQASAHHITRESRGDAVEDPVGANQHQVAWSPRHGAELRSSMNLRAQRRGEDVCRAFQPLGTEERLNLAIRAENHASAVADIGVVQRFAVADDQDQCRAKSVSVQRQTKGIGIQNQAEVGSLDCPAEHLQHVGWCIVDIGQADRKCERGAGRCPGGRLTAMQNAAKSVCDHHHEVLAEVEDDSSILVRAPHVAPQRA